MGLIFSTVKHLLVQNGLIFCNLYSAGKDLLVLIVGKLSRLPLHTKSWPFGYASDLDACSIRLDLLYFHCADAELYFKSCVQIVICVKCFVMKNTKKLSLFFLKRAAQRLLSMAIFLLRFVGLQQCRQSECFS